MSKYLQHKDNPPADVTDLKLRVHTVYLSEGEAAAAFFICAEASDNG